MISLWRDRLFRQTWHPSLEELTLHLDGELGAKNDRVGVHTKSCWSCRMRLEKIDRAISEFMEARNASFAGSPAFPTETLRKFKARLDGLESECGSPNLFSDVTREWTQGLFASRSSIRLAIVLASLVLIVAIFFRLNLTQPVSAKEVLFQVRQAEVRQMMQVPAPVIYEKLQLRRSLGRHLETVTWEIWNDIRNDRLRQRVNAVPQDVPALLEDFGEVFRNHQADPGRPLSPNNYEVWRDSIPQESEEVLDGTLSNGDKATILRVSGQGPFPPNGIVGAEFTVRAADWHPVGQRLLLRQRDQVVDYSLGEVAFNVMALSAVPPSIFADPAPAPTRISHVPVRRLMPVPVHVDLWPEEADLLPTAADLTAAEVEARYALHNVRACIGRPVEVRLGIGRIEVEGVVDTEERKEEILLALRGIPHVIPEIRTVAEAANAEHVNGEGAAANSDQPTADELSAPKLAIEDLLRRYFSAGKCVGPTSEQSACVQEAIAGLSREALAHSEATQGQAWALRRLVEWGPFLARHELRTSSERLLDLMVRDHIDALRSELEQWRARLKPVLSALSSSDSSEIGAESTQTRDSSGDWVTLSLLRLCTTVEEAGNLTLGTFAETNRPVSQPEQAMKQLLSKLEGLNGGFSRLQADVSAELSGFSNKLISSEKTEQK